MGAWLPLISHSLPPPLPWPQPASHRAHPFSQKMTVTLLICLKPIDQGGCYFGVRSACGERFWTHIIRSLSTFSPSLPPHLSWWLHPSLWLSCWRKVKMMLNMGMTLKHRRLMGVMASWTAQRAKTHLKNGVDEAETLQWFKWASFLFQHH